MKIAVVGATGLVGNVMLQVLDEHNFPVTELIPVASSKSLGKEVVFRNKSYKIVSVDDAIAMKTQIALFSAGASASKEYAPRFAEVGCFVIDNSSAWRMDTDKKLIVPEINAAILTPNDKIIANPNCSTIQLVMVMAPLHKRYKMRRVVVSTYQSVTGTGVKAVKQMENERNSIEGEMAYKYQIDKNCIPQCDVFVENGYTKEEMKLVNESHKILGDNTFGVSSTAIRVPVVGGHSESVNIEFYNDFDLQEVRSILQNTEGLVVQDDVDNYIYPMPKFSQGKDEVFVGRIRRDFSQPNSLNMWVVADNLRKGAATNAVQIAEYLVKNIIK